MTFLAVFLAAFAGMELVSYLSHRFVMHGFGIGLHQSHHEVRQGRFELNDLYPLMFSSVAIGAFAAGTALPNLRLLLAAGGGITLYGVSYLFVHEIHVHRRVAIATPRWRYLEWLRQSHRIHHLFGAEPYGMLLPITVPAKLRQRARGIAYDPFGTGLTVPNEPRPPVLGGPAVPAVPAAAAEPAELAAPATPA